MSGRHEAGSASVVGLALGLVAVLLSILVADIGIFMAGRARAKVAADAAALAAAPVTFRAFGGDGDPQAEAAQAAAINGATLLSCRCARDESWRARSVLVRVVVRTRLILLGDHAVGATSRATFEPTRLGR